MVVLFLVIAGNGFQYVPRQVLHLDRFHISARRRR
jgi:hypothetical protein